MAAGGRVGGDGGPVKRVVWLFIAACIVVAVWNSFPHDPEGFYAELKNKSESLAQSGGRVADWIETTVGGAFNSDNDASGASQGGPTGTGGADGERTGYVESPK